MKRTSSARRALVLSVACVSVSGLAADVHEARAQSVSPSPEQSAQAPSARGSQAQQGSAAGAPDPTAPAAGPLAPVPDRPAAPSNPRPAAPTAVPARDTKPEAPQPGGGAGPGDEHKHAAKPCVKRPKRPKRSKNHVRPTGKADEATHGGLVNTRENAKSATTGCQHAAASKQRRKHKRKRGHHKTSPSSVRDRGGARTFTDATTALVSPGAIPRGVPSFFIEKFRIPPFLLAIYQAAGIQYGIRWEILAAINEIESDYGRNLSVSSAGALGWMQFMPATWRTYGVDANRDGRKDPFNPVDAIFAAARYLKAAGADRDLRRGIFAYNHAGWYVDSVLARARLIGAMPADLVDSLSGLTQGRRPLHARAAVAVQDGTIVALGRTKRLGRFVRLRDVYGNTYTYGKLGRLATKVAVPKRRTQSRRSIARELELPKRDPKPTAPATAGRQPSQRAAGKAPKSRASAGRAAAADAASALDLPRGPLTKERLFAHPARRHVLPHGGSRQLAQREYALGDRERLRDYVTGNSGLRRGDIVLKPLTRGRRVIAGTVLGRTGKTRAQAPPSLMFEIRPAGRGAPRIDPKPILDGWRLLESTAIYHARGDNAISGPRASIGQILLMSKETLTRRVLSNPRIEVYSCGRRDIKSGVVDRRVLATLEFLAASGLKPTVTSFRCGHGFYTSSGNVSAHSSGNAVDIAKINNIPIIGNQGPGSITDIAVRRLLTLQGTMKPAQIITLMKYDGTDNTLALADHDDHIHVGFRPTFDLSTKAGKMAEAVLKPSQWIHLIDRLGDIANPTVKVKPSKYAIRVPVRRRRGG